MDRDKIAHLQQSASEQYLRGEFREALRTWESVLAIDPNDDQAREGARLASLLVDGSDDGPPPVAAPADPSFPESVLGGLRDRVEGVRDRLSPRPGPPVAGCASVAEGGRPLVEEQLALAQAHLAAGRSVDCEAACRKVLALDPAEPKALRLLGECSAAGDAPSPFEDELSVLDRLAPRAVEPASAPPSPTMKAAAGPDAAGPSPDLNDPDGAEGAAVVGLAPFTPPAAASGATIPGGTTQSELLRRVQDLLVEARSAAEAGRAEDGLAVLSRVFILDEENEEARALEEELRAAIGRTAMDLENWITEGIAAFGAGRLDEARALFGRVLERVPSHAEALDYLDRIDAELAKQEGEAEAKVIPLARDEGASPRGSAAATAEIPPTVRTAGDDALALPIAPPARPAREPRVPVVTPAAPRRRGWILWAVVAAVLVCAAGFGGWIALSRLLGETETAVRPDAPPVPEAPALPRETREARPRAVPPPAPRPAPPATLSDAIARARAAMQAGDPGAAVIAYNQAVQIDPASDEARAGLIRAGEAYKVEKLEHEQMDRIRAAFAEEDYAAALRILYRMPAGARTDEVERLKVDGWYNLGLIALKGANCREAVTNFDEALAIRPGDEDVRRAKALAVRYREASKDRAFYGAVEALPFRTF